MPSDAELIELALRTRERAYAPYSNYHVGAAVRMESGRLFGGCNVENASYGLTICAERSAIFQAVAAGEKKLIAVAVAATNGVTPCGACRQVLAEFGPQARVLLVDADAPTRVTEYSLADLLPHQFVLGG